MGLEYVKARFVALRRKFPKEAEEQLGDIYLPEELNMEAATLVGYESDKNPSSMHREDLGSLNAYQKVPRPASVPGSPRSKKSIEDFARLFLDDEDEE